MPTYDVECPHCLFADDVVLKLAELSAWDAAAQCPNCESRDYRRVIIQAPAVFGGAKAAARSVSSHKIAQKERFVKSGEKDDMLHKSFKSRNNSDERAAARESVRKGEFEGF